MFKKILGIAVIVCVSCLLEIIHMIYERNHGPAAFKLKIFPTY